MSTYKEQLKEIQKTFCEGCTELISSYMNYIHEVFSDKKKAKKFIRENGLNRLEKINELWLYQNMPAVQKGDFTITIKEPEEIKEELKLDISEEQIEEIRKEFAKEVPEYLWKSC